MANNLLSAFNFLKLLVQRQSITPKGEVLNTNDIPLPAISILLCARCIEGTHAFGFNVSQVGMNLVELQFEEPIKRNFNYEQ